MNKYLYNLLISPIVIFVTIPLSILLFAFQVVAETFAYLAEELYERLPRFRKY
jgi:uncharacterized membrane protein YvlD (DUF360 family)